MKRKTEAMKKAALLQRVTDIYSGAMGAYWGPEEFATAEILSRVIPTLRETFRTQWKDHLHSAHVLSYYNSAQEASDFLYRNGVRA